MCPRFLRLLSFVLLLSLFTVTSGIASTASALLTTDAPDVCCTGTSEKPAAPIPCETPDCVCPFCMATAMIAEAIAVVSAPAASVRYTGMVVRSHLQEYLPSIEYPPETVS